MNDIPETVAEAVENNKGRIGALMPVLHDVQHALGYIPPKAVPIIAKALNLSRAEVQGVIGFYHDFHTEPGGETIIQVCRAEACQASGGQELEAHAKKRLGIDFGGTTEDILGLEWGESPSETKVFVEDKKLPKDLYSRLSDEMWYATQRWISNGTMKFMPTLDSTELFHELQTRRVHQGAVAGRKARVEQKKDWKARNGNKSPDRADSLVQIQQIIRVRDTNIPGLIKDKQHVIQVDENDFPQNVATTRNLLHSIRQKK